MRLQPDVSRPALPRAAGKMASERKAEQPRPRNDMNPKTNAARPKVALNRLVRPYKAKSISGAQDMVRRLRKQIAERDALLTRFDRERRLMAKLASDDAKFFNPVEAWEATRLREELLRRPNAERSDSE